MHKTCFCLLLMLAYSAMPRMAQAQWATSRTEHDWRMTTGDYAYGLVEMTVYQSRLTSGTRITTIYVGPFSWSTLRVGAVQIVAGLLLALGTLVVISVKWLREPCR